MNEQLYHILNRQVANFTVMYMKLHNFHWFITDHIFINCMKNLNKCMMKLPRI